MPEEKPILLAKKVHVESIRRYSTPAERLIFFQFSGKVFVSEYFR